VIDWHHPQYDFTRSKILAYPERGREIAVTPRNHDRYIEFLHNQVDELTSNYGPVDVLWWDYSSTDFQGDAAWRAMDLIAKVRAKQPQVIMNNRLFRIPEAGFSGMGMDDITGKLDPQYGDFITPEQFIPATGLPDVDWESCMTMNTGWGYNEHDHDWKSAEEIVRNLIDIASKGGNYLLNIGPKGDGLVPADSVTRMNEVGAWMKENSEAIYGTTASPLEKTPFDGRITTKGKIHYAHVFSRPESGQIELPLQIEKATLAASGTRLEIRTNGTQSVIMLPANLPNPIATVIRLE
jgi:alpha-L-fucosidase